MTEATNELCTLCLHISQYVKPVKGKLDAYEVTGYLVADFLGIELLPPPDSKEALNYQRTRLRAARGEGRRPEEEERVGEEVQAAPEA